MSGIDDPVDAYDKAVQAASADEWARLDAANADTDAYAKGAADLKAVHLTALRKLRAEAITSERKSAYDTAISTIEGLQP